MIQNNNKIPQNSKVSYMIEGARQSRFNAAHWFRYLRKCVDGDAVLLNSDDVDLLINSGELTMYQIITLKRAMQPGTITNQKVNSLNQRSTTPMVKELLRRFENA